MKVQVKILNECFNNKIDLNNLELINRFYNFKPLKGKRKRKDITINEKEYKKFLDTIEEKKIKLSAYIKFLYEMDFTNSIEVKKENENTIEEIEPYECKYMSMALYRKIQREIERQNNCIDLYSITKDEDTLNSTYKAFLKNAKFESNKEKVFSSKDKIINTLIDISIKEKLTEFRFYNTSIVDRVELKKKLNNQLYSTSKGLSRLLYLYYRFIFSEFIDDFLRYDMLKNYYELYQIKSGIVMNEITKIGSFDFFKSINHILFKKFDNVYNNCHYIDFIDLSTKQFKMKEYNTFIGSDIIKMQWTCLPCKLQETKFQSGYIEPISKPKLYYLKGEKQTQEYYNQQPKEIKDQFEITYKNDYPYHVFCDTETDSKCLQEILCKENDKSYLKFKDKTCIEISLDEYNKLDEINKSDIKRLKLKEIIDIINNQKTKDLITNKIFQYTRLQIIQAYFVNEFKPEQNKIIMWVNEDKKEYYGKNELKHTYPQGIKGQKIKRNVKAEIRYTKNLVDDYMGECLKFYGNIVKTEKPTKAPTLCIWFHNLKFDLLAMGMLNKVDRYGLKSNIFSNSSPCFYNFETNLVYTNKSGKEKTPKLLFFDSFNLMTTSLAKMGNTIGIRKEIEKFDYKNNDNLKVTNKVLEYSLMDVVILKEAMLSLKKVIYKYGSLGYSSASTTMKSYLCSFYKGKQYMNKVTGETLTENEYSYLLQFRNINTGELLSYNQYKNLDKKTVREIINILVAEKSENLINEMGLTKDNYKKNNEFKKAIKEFKENISKNEAYKNNISEFRKTWKKEDTEDKKNYKLVDYRIYKHKNPLLEAIEFYAYAGGRTECFNRIGFYPRVLSLDINSSYPSSMLHKLPYRYLYSKLNPDMAEVEQIFNSDDKYLIAEIFVKKDSSKLLFSKRMTMLLYDDIENGTTIINEPELKKILSINGENVTIKSIYVYKATDKLFTEFINYWCFQKTYNKQVTLDQAMTALAKLFMNSAYGKFAEKLNLTNNWKMSENELLFYNSLVSARDINKSLIDKPYSLDEFKNYVGDYDFELTFDNDNCGIACNKADINPYEREKIIYDLRENFSCIDMTSIRLRFCNGFLSYKKKLLTSAENAFCPIAGAITSYSRVALYNAIEKIGINNMVYCDTDSVYFIAPENFKSIEDLPFIKEIILEIPYYHKDTNEKISFNEYTNLTKKEQKNYISEMYLSREKYNYWLNEHNKEAVKYPDKILVSQSLVSQYYFWELEYPEPYAILVRGNKDNLKFFYYKKEDIFILNDRSLEEKQRFLNDDNSKIAMCKSDIKKFNKYLVDGKYMIHTVIDNEKLKGLTKSALMLNIDTYYYNNFMAYAMQVNQYGDIDGQIIEPNIKVQNKSRENYTKAETIKKTNKSLKFMYADKIRDTYSNILHDKKIIIQSDIMEYKYVEQIIKPYVSNMTDKGNIIYDEVV